MDASVVHEQVTDELLRQLGDSKYQDAPMMDRIEGRIRTRAQLERYVQVLVHKLEQSKFRSVTMFDRLDRATNLLERFDRHAAGTAR